MPVAVDNVHAYVTAISNPVLRRQFPRFAPPRNNAPHIERILYPRLARRISVALLFAIKRFSAFPGDRRRRIIRSSPRTGRDVEPFCFAPFSPRSLPLPFDNERICAITAEARRTCGPLFSAGERRTRLTPLPRWLPQAESIGFLTGVIVGRGAAISKRENASLEPYPLPFKVRFLLFFFHPLLFGCLQLSQ